MLLGDVLNPRRTTAGGQAECGGGGGAVVRLSLTQRYACGLALDLCTVYPTQFGAAQPDPCYGVRCFSELNWCLVLPWANWSWPMLLFSQMALPSGGEILDSRLHNEVRPSRRRASGVGYWQVAPWRHFRPSRRPRRRCGTSRLLTSGRCSATRARYGPPHTHTRYKTHSHIIITNKLTSDISSTLPVL